MGVEEKRLCVCRRTLLNSCALHSEMRTRPIDSACPRRTTPSFLIPLFRLVIIPKTPLPHPLESLVQTGCNHQYVYHIARYMMLESLTKKLYRSVTIETPWKTILRRCYDCNPIPCGSIAYRRCAKFEDYYCECFCRRCRRMREWIH